MAIRITATSNGPGLPDTVIMIPVPDEMETGGDGASLMGRTLTRAQERRKRLAEKSAAPPSIEKIVILDEEWFIRAVDFEALTRIAILTPRDQEGRIFMGAHGALAALMTAMVYVCCVVGEGNATPFFENWEDAHEFVRGTSESEVHTNNVLFSNILSQSPDIWPEGADQIKKAERDEADALPLASMSLPPESPPNGFETMESTALPAG